MHLVKVHPSLLMIQNQLSKLFNFLKISILNIIALFAIILSISLSSVSTTLETGTLLCTTLSTCLCIHLSAGSLESCIQFGHSAIDSSQVLCLVSIFQLLESSLNRSLLVGRKLVTQFLQLIFSRENHGVGLVQLVDTFLFLLVGFGIGFGFSLHTFDFFFAQAAGSFDTDSLFLACSLILGRYLQDTVGIDIESYLDLRNTTTSRSDTCQVELTD